MYAHLFIHGFLGVPICHPLGLLVLAGALIGCDDANDSEHPEYGARKRVPFIFVPRGIACDCLQSFVLCGEMDFGSGSFVTFWVTHNLDLTHIRKKAGLFCCHAGQCQDI